jgi:hypothetical protein
LGIAGRLSDAAGGYRGFGLFTGFRGHVDSKYLDVPFMESLVISLMREFY